MSVIEYRLGMLVTNPKAPQWGPGKVLLIEPEKLTVYFRDIREDKPGDALRKLSRRHVTLEAAPRQSDPWLDNIPPFKDGKLDLLRARWTLDQAIEFFKKTFPLGFDDPAYLDVDTGERPYKWRAHQRFLSTLGKGEGERLLKEGDISELTNRVLSVVGAVNLLSPMEQIALRDALKNIEASKSFFRTLFYTIAQPRPERGSFESYIDAVTSLPAKKDRARVATWPVLTIMPFLARPDAFMLLKPEITKHAAETLAFDLLYDPKLNWTTYEKLLTMSRLLMDQLRPLGARDLIDVQSFMWVTGSS